MSLFHSCTYTHTHLQVCVQKHKEARGRHTHTNIWVSVFPGCSPCRGRKFQKPRWTRRGSGSHGFIIAPGHAGSLPVMCVFWCLRCRSRDSARANPALVARRVGSAESSSGAIQRSNVTVGGQHTSPPQDGPLNQFLFLSIQAVFQHEHKILCNPI